MMKLYTFKGVDNSMTDDISDIQMARVEFDRIYKYALQYNKEFAEKKEYYFGIFFEGYMACAMTIRKLLDQLKK